jgi:hypothetical protein
VRPDAPATPVPFHAFSLEYAGAVLRFRGETFHFVGRQAGDTAGTGYRYFVYSR